MPARAPKFENRMMEFHFHFKSFLHKIQSAKSNLTKRGFYQLISYTKRKILKTNGIADLPGSHALMAFG